MSGDGFVAGVLAGWLLLVLLYFVVIIVKSHIEWCVLNKLQEDLSILRLKDILKRLEK